MHGQGRPEHLAYLGLIIEDKAALHSRSGLERHHPRRREAHLHGRHSADDRRQPTNHVRWVQERRELPNRKSMDDRRLNPEQAGA